jgi:hypothetical protein
MLQRFIVFNRRSRDIDRRGRGPIPR